MLDRMSDRVVRWRSMAVLFFLGALLAEVALLLAHRTEMVIEAEWAITTTALLGAAWRCTSSRRACPSG